MLRLRYILLSICACFVFSLSAQKVYKPIRAALKSKNVTHALQLIAPLMADSNYRNDSRLYEYAISANLLAHEAENTKAYLKQKYDTIKFFSSSLSLIKNILVLDSLDQALKPKKSVAPEYSDLIPRFLPHINSAGRYFFQKKQYTQAIVYFNTYLTMPERFTALLSIPQKKRVETAYLCTKSYFLSQQYKEVSQYSDVLLTDSALKCVALEYYTLSAEAQKDSTQYLSYLNKGVEMCSDVPFFFTRLIDYHILQNQAKEALVLADSLLKEDTTNIILMEGRCLALIALHKYKETIDQAKQMLQMDSAAVYPNYYIGASYANLANNIEMPTNINSQKFKQATRQRKALYSAALPYLERFREKVPTQQKMWAPLLYKIYLSTENEAKFKEMDAILQTL